MCAYFLSAPKLGCEARLCVYLTLHNISKREVVLSITSVRSGSVVLVIVVNVWSHLVFFWIE